MAKRFANVFFITLGIALTCVIAFALVLFLAPGLSVFGVKYIAKGTHIINENTVIGEKLSGNTFSGSIRLEVDEMPVYVVFSQKFTYQIQYYDNYCGLTTSKFDDPSITYSKESDGTAVIKVSSFKKFIYENGNSSRYVKLFIPSTIVGGTKAGQTDLSIISKSSSVYFSDEKNDYYDPYFKNIKIETSGKVVSSTKVTADNYSLKTINTINISDNEVDSINATNYILNSTGGKIVVNRNVLGDITATTKDARIQILTCKNFTADSGFGDIYSASKEQGIVVNGIANIKTTAGVVEIDSILGSTEKSIIETKTGNVTIKTAKDLNITTTRGFVKVSAARKANVTTSSGSVTLETATDSVSVKTKRGKVFLGGENNVLYNPTVESTYGNVSVMSASGTVKLETIKANISFTNTDASNIKINAGGNLTADKLMGAVNVQVSGNAALDFANFTQKSTIVGTNAKSLITIKMYNNESSTFSYNLEGNDAILCEYNADDPENSYQIGKSTSLTSSPEMVGKPLLTATNAGRLEVYYKKSI